MGLTSCLIKVPLNLEKARLSDVFGDFLVTQWPRSSGYQRHGMRISQCDKKAIYLVEDKTSYGMSWQKKTKAMLFACFGSILGYFVGGIWVIIPHPISMGVSRREPDSTGSNGWWLVAELLFDVTQHGKPPRDSHFVEVFQRDKHQRPWLNTISTCCFSSSNQISFWENMVLTCKKQKKPWWNHQNVQQNPFSQDFPHRFLGFFCSPWAAAPRAWDPSRKPSSSRKWWERRGPFIRFFVLPSGYD